MNESQRPLDGIEPPELPKRSSNSGGPESGQLGLAGEFRVMSELLLRGHNPAKSYLEYGADIVLENGLRLEVKTGHQYDRLYKNNYHFFTATGHGQRVVGHRDYDFLVCWCFDADVFYIVPQGSIPARKRFTLSISPKSRYFPFRGAWNLLEKGR